MAALFPQAAACQDNLVGPVEIPDNVIVRQTVDDTLHEALDVDGLRALLEAMERGDVTVHTVDTTEPSVLAHEILTARPYAFLDDEELAEPTHERGAHPPRPRRRPHRDRPARPRRHRARCTPRSRRSPRRRRPARPAVLARRHDAATPEWQPLWQRARARRTRAVARPRRRKRCGARPRCSPTRDDCSTATTRPRSSSCAATSSSRASRRSSALAASAALTAGQVAIALAALEHDGFALQGSYTRDAEPIEWVARRLLARMHSYSRKHAPRVASSPRPPRTSCASVCGGSTSRPAPNSAGVDGLATVIGRLQGWEAAAAAWEPELIRRRLRALRHERPRPPVPRGRDRLAAARAPPARRRRTGRRAEQGDADLGGVPRRPAAGCSKPHATAAIPTNRRVGATAEIVEHLRARGACFAAELGQATRRLPEDVERGLWDGVSRGLLTSDGFGAIRAASTSAHVEPSRRGFPG